MLRGGEGRGTGGGNDTTEKCACEQVCMKGCPVQTIKDIEPAFRQMTCGPKANNMATVSHPPPLTKKISEPHDTRTHTHTPRQEHLCVWNQCRNQHVPISAIFKDHSSVSLAEAKNQIISKHVHSHTGVGSASLRAP